LSEAEMLEQALKPVPIDWSDVKANEPDPNAYHTGPVSWIAMFERILIIEDRFRSGYECDECDETGKVPCTDCVDGHSSLNAEILCKTCEGSKLKMCEPCKGKGVLLDIPEVAQRRPTTGTVVSIGQDVHTVKRGDTVLYSNYVGEVYDLPGVDQLQRPITVTLRVMKEREIICRVEGHLELKRVKRHEFQGGG
jgi:co-chaperonin GroES (HSP10)